MEGGRCGGKGERGGRMGNWSDESGGMGKGGWKMRIWRGDGWRDSKDVKGGMDGGI